LGTLFIIKRKYIMKLPFRFFLIVIFTAIYIYDFAQTHTSYVEPFIGSVGDGNVFVGPSCPFGMVKPGPDCKISSNSGYTSDMDCPVYGFSHVHVSGTGGGPKYGNVSIMPFGGDFSEIRQESVREQELAECGFYSVGLKKWGIKAELTTSERAAFHRYIYPGKQGVKLDLGTFLGEEPVPDSREAQQFVGSEIEIISDKEARGYTRIRGGWNNGKAYTVYFYAVFNRAFKQSGTWSGNEIFPSVDAQPDKGEKTGAYFYFDENGPDTLLVKVGISFISSLKAKENVSDEIPHWDFEKELGETQQKWETLLSKIEIDASSTKEQKSMFYTALYHTMLMPVDRTGENPLWRSSAPYYDDFYALWDTYRTSHPLITLIDPNRQSEIVNSLLDIYKYDDYMPDARSGNCNGRTQGGSNAEVLIADAYSKGLSGINYHLGLRAMLKDATIPPGGNQESEGRGGLGDYNSLGYISNKYVRAGNRTLEYAFNDFCLAQVAKGLGRNGEYHRFMAQSENWKNLWRDIEHEGSKGFIMPKDASGNWIDSVPCNFSDGQRGYVKYYPLAQEWPICVCWWCGFFYEGSSWEYSFFVPHDIPGLVKLSGGGEAFRNRLDTFFNNGYYDVGNEPSFLTPLLYHWIGRPDLSSSRVNEIVNINYNASKSGIPGNDDSGAMSSRLAFHMMGIYPNAGMPYYLITTPILKKTVIHLENNKSFTITADKLSAKNCYIKSAKLNGEPFNQAWIKHAQVINGGELILEMSPVPSNWGKEILPPVYN
jgi:predicted alpha-1,2-mannosidase